MKRFIALVLCAILVLSLAGCGSVPMPGEEGSKPLTYTDSEKNEISYNETAGLFSVNGTLYRATGKSYGEAICGEEIKNLALPISDGRTVTAWSPLYDGIIVVLIDGEWQEFMGEEDHDELPDICVMTATILDISDGTMTVEPVEGSWELSSCDRFSVPVVHMNASPEPKIGDIIEISYDGSIEETYPARLGNITGIEVVGSAAGGDACPKVTINGITYYDRGNNPLKTGLPPADFSVYEESELSVEGAFSGTATAYAVCDDAAYLLINGEWYEFIMDGIEPDVSDEKSLYAVDACRQYLIENEPAEVIATIISFDAPEVEVIEELPADWLYMELAGNAGTGPYYQVTFTTTADDMLGPIVFLVNQETEVIGIFYRE